MGTQFDAVGVLVYNAPILAAVTWSNSIDVLGVDEVNYRIKVGNLGVGPITSIVAMLQWTDTLTPNNEDWNTVKLETLKAGGVITEDDALYTFDVSALPVSFSLPVIGVASGRLMRLGLLAVGGDPTSSAVAWVMRRAT